MNRSSRVWMVGPGETQPGGMTAVVQSYREAGLFDDGTVVYHSSYEGPRILTQLQVFGLLVFRLLAALLRRRVALLHVHSAARGSFWRKSMLCALVSIFGRPYIFHVHSGEFLRLLARGDRPVTRWWMRRTLNRSACVLALTPSWRDALAVECPQAFIRVAPNPVEVPPEMPGHEDSQTVLFLGRLRATKGADDLLAAWQQVLHRWPSARLLMAGDGDIPKYEARAKELGIASQVSFVGWVSGEAKRELLRCSNVFVLPSYYEGLPIGILEALAQGLAVVASRVGGIPDLVSDGKTALLHDAGDVPALAEALARVLEDGELRHRLASAGRQVVLPHDQQRVVSALSAFYEELLLGQRPVTKELS